MSVGTVFVALAAALFREELITVLFSAKYTHVGLAFALLMISFQLTVGAHLLGCGLVSAGHPALPVKINSVTSVFNLFANWFFITKYGFIGAVYTALLSYLLELFINDRFAQRVTCKVDLTRHFVPLGIFALIVSVLYLIRVDSYELRCFSVVLYAGLCLLVFKELRRAVTMVFRYA